MRWLTNLWNDQEELMTNFKCDEQEVLVKDKPKSTSIYTSEQLEKMGMFGLWAKEK